MAVEAKGPAIARQLEAITELVACADAAQVGIAHLEAEDTLVAVTGVDHERGVAFGARADAVNAGGVVGAAGVAVDEPAIGLLGMGGGSDQEHGAGEGER